MWKVFFWNLDLCEVIGCCGVNFEGYKESENSCDIITDDIIARVCVIVYIKSRFLCDLKIQVTDCCFEK